MAIGLLNTNTPVAAPARAAASSAAAPTAGAVSAYGADGYVPAQPAMRAQAAGMNVGRFASWGLGALAAFKFVLPALGGPSGWVRIAVMGAGALAGNLVWNKMERDVDPAKAGSVGHLGTIGAGAVGGFFLGRSILGDNPAGWLLGGLTGVGAWLGHKLYAGMSR